MTYAREREAALAVAGTLSKANVVRFNALACRLTGTVGAVSFGPWTAVSGAGLNSSANLPGTKLAAWLPGKKTTGKHRGERGGVIPPGWWVILPEVLGAGETSTYVRAGAAPTDFALKLVPLKLDVEDGSIFGACERGGFYIHGASRNSAKVGAGSDGCILLALSERHWLARQVHQAKGAWLHVFLDGRKINDMIEIQQAGARIA